MLRRKYHDSYSLPDASSNVFMNFQCGKQNNCYSKNAEEIRDGLAYYFMDQVQFRGNRVYYFKNLIVKNEGSNYLLKLNNKNTRRRCEICSKLTIKALS